MDFGGKKNPSMKEAQLEDKYIKPLFSYLNWNTRNENLKRGFEEFRVQTSLRMRKSTKEPDYELWLPDKENGRMKRHLFMEAKDPKYDLSSNVQYMRQAYRYAYSTLSLSDNTFNRTRLSLLTDFEEFRLFDCRDPEPLKANKSELFNKYIVKPFDLRYDRYVEEFDNLWDAFERNNVYNGSLKEYELTDEKLKRNRIAPDMQFLNDLKNWRLDFAKSMYQSNKEVSSDFLTSASQMMINRIIFLKMLTDRGIEDDYLTKILDRLTKDKEEISIYDSCQSVFEELDKKYNGDIFKKKGDFDHIKIENKVFKKVIEALKPEKSVYTLAAMPVEIIGNVYEEFLGEVISFKGKGLSLEYKPEVQKAGGVYYTPRYIVDYIVENTLGEKLRECKTPEAVSKIKILDPACGSGSFLIAAFDRLIAWHEDYFRSRVDAKFKDKKSESEIRKTFKNEIKLWFIENGQYILHLTSKLKKDILRNNIFGVDIDPHAVDITMFSLSMKALENATHEEVDEDRTLFNEQILPDLKLHNIKCGNSLIGSDFYADKDLTLFGGDELRQVNVFDWDKQFAEIMADGGFDVVIGNPPYFNIQTLGVNSPIANHIQKKYSQIWMDKSDILFYFIAKAIQLSKGCISFIVSNAFLFADKAQKLRNHILEKAPLIKIINFEKHYVFENASITTAIILMDKSKRDTLCRFISFNESKLTPDYINQIIDNESNYKEIGLQENSVFALIDNHIETLNRKIDASKPILRDVVLVGKGMETAANDVFLFKEFPNQFPDQFIKKRMSGEIISRYYIDKEIEYLLYVEDVEGFNELPSIIKDHLLLNKKTLQNRADKIRRKTAVWWNYTFAMHREYYHLNKIWCSYRSKNNEFVYDDTSDYIGLTNTTVIFDTNESINLKYILALLNSKLLNFRYKSIGKQTGSGVYEYFENGIGKLPIIIQNKDSEVSHKLVSLVDQMLTVQKKLHEAKTEHDKEVFQRQADTLDAQIDRIVYDLYGLTEEEIKIVEGNR